MSGTTSDTALKVLFDRLPENGHNKALGIDVLGYGKGWTECFLDWREDLVADAKSGVLASGPIISLMDVACGTAVWSAVDDIETSVTLDLRVDYLRPARPGRRVIGRGECYHVTRRIAFVRGMAHDGEPDRPVAHVSGSFVFTRKE